MRRNRHRPDPVSALEADREHRLHLERLAKVKAGKGRLDNAPPKTMDLPHLKKNPKKAQMVAERQREIYMENLKLVKNLERIMSRPADRQYAPRTDPSAMSPRYNRGVDFVHRRRQEMKRLQEENAAILRRLEASKPHISASVLEKQFERQEEYLHQISDFEPPKVPARAAVGAVDSRPRASRKTQQKYEASSPASRSPLSSVHDSPSPVFSEPTRPTLAGSKLAAPDAAVAVDGVLARATAAVSPTSRGPRARVRSLPTAAPRRRVPGARRQRNRPAASRPFAGREKNGAGDDEDGTSSGRGGARGLGGVTAGASGVVGIRFQGEKAPVIRAGKRKGKAVAKLPTMPEPVSRPPAIPKSGASPPPRIPRAGARLPAPVFSRAEHPVRGPPAARRLGGPAQRARATRKPAENSEAQGANPAPKRKRSKRRLRKAKKRSDEPSAPSPPTAGVDSVGGDGDGDGSHLPTIVPPPRTVAPQELRRQVSASPPGAPSLPTVVVAPPPPIADLAPTVQKEDQDGDEVGDGSLETAARAPRSSFSPVAGEAAKGPAEVRGEEGVRAPRGLVQTHSSKRLGFRMIRAESEDKDQDACLSLGPHSSDAVAIEAEGDVQTERSRDENELGEHAETDSDEDMYDDDEFDEGPATLGASDPTTCKGPGENGDGEYDDDAEEELDDDDDGVDEDGMRTHPHIPTNLGSSVVAPGQDASQVGATGQGTDNSGEEDEEDEEDSYSDDGFDEAGQTIVTRDGGGGGVSDNVGDRDNLGGFSPPLVAPLADVPAHDSDVTTTANAAVAVAAAAVDILSKPEFLSDYGGPTSARCVGVAVGSREEEHVHVDESEEDDDDDYDDDFDDEELDGTHGGGGTSPGRFL